GTGSLGPRGIDRRYVAARTGGRAGSPGATRRGRPLRARSAAEGARSRSRGPAEHGGRTLPSLPRARRPAQPPGLRDQGSNRPGLAAEAPIGPFFLNRGQVGVYPLHSANEGVKSPIPQEE